MSNDYTPRKEDEAFALPPAPGPDFTDSAGIQNFEKDTLLAYGHACAEAARAPLLARIAELESLLVAVIEDTAEELGCAPDNEAILLAADRLRAEVEKYKSDAERYAYLKSIAKAGITKRQEFVITLDLVPCPNHIGELDAALDADRNYNNKEPTPE